MTPSEEAERLLSNPISKRLAYGWYPSTRDPETGAVVHDRHVLIWVRHYERLIEALLNELA